MPKKFADYIAYQVGRIVPCRPKRKKCFKTDLDVHCIKIASGVEKGMAKDPWSNICT